MDWAERLARERRARLAAERLLEHKSRALIAAHQQLAEHARRLADEVIAQRDAVAAALSEAEEMRSLHGQVLAELEEAHGAAVMAERRLWESIEAIRDGFAVFDRDRRLLGANRAWLRLFRGIPEVARGITYDRLLELCTAHGLIDLGEEAPGAWIARMQARWQARRMPPLLLRLTGGTWLRLIDRRARDGDRVMLAVDITEMVEYEARLTRERARAEAANRAKSAFLANMSHEIRTPMNGVVGMAELLCETPLTDDQRLYAETIRSSGEALLHIINDILDYSKIEAHKLALYPEPFDLERTIHEVMMLVQPGARARDLALLIDYDQFLPSRFVADPGRIRQVLTNLVGNAVKFTETGHVLVRVVGMEAGGGAWDLRLTVEDTGIGIAPEHLDHVFGEFNQVEEAPNRRFAGTGLGLAITRELIAMMGGEVWVESEPGRGSCFGIRLRLAAAEELGAAPAGPLTLRHALVVDDLLINRTILERQLAAQGLKVTPCHGGAEALRLLERGCTPDVVLTDHEMPGMDGVALAEALRGRGWDGPILLLTSNPARLRVAEAAALSVTVLQKPVLRRELMRRLAALGRPEPPAAAPAPDAPAASAGRRAMRVLSAEDNRTNQLVLAKMVKGLDIELAFAGDGAEAVAMYQSFRPDLVFMDISMPGMDGREATRAIRRLEAGGRRVPIVALTAHAMEGDGDEILAAGLDDYLTKPLRRAALAERIRAHAPPDVRPPEAPEAPDVRPPEAAEAPDRPAATGPR